MELRDLLAPIYTHVTKGFGTADLMTAKGPGVMTPGHLRDGLGECVTTCRSLIKATTRQRVGNLGEEGLLVRLPTP